MGCDGGTIPKRDELVKKKQKPEEKDKQADTAAKWNYCTISCQQLRKPIVSCPLGFLYNKEAIIRYLLDKETKNETVSHIRGLKDVKELNLTEKPGFVEKAVESGLYIQESQYICPVTTLEMNGKYKFCYLQACGCVISERALKEVKSETCHKCGKPFTEEDIIIINGTDAEIASARIKMEEKRLKEKSEKKGKKRKAVAIEEEGESSKFSVEKSIADGQASGAGVKSIKSKPDMTKTKPSTSAILSGKIKDDYSVAKDETASEAYKSLFTSHPSAKNKPKIPMYNCS
ncbi:replication termination factor 2-like [Panonychus citri]|uniref:replication termination factor 2-like n=1 Tax=Panonychus citri TaxID=50023 RepID=UPI002307A248|nr:replication termination factor 2-like [Panonychus citri]XP_053207132.1 replication termination factor 2-like [Panonychus citri]